MLRQDRRLKDLARTREREGAFWPKAERRPGAATDPRACGIPSLSGRRASVRVNKTAEPEPETQRTGARRPWTQVGFGGQGKGLGRRVLREIATIVSPEPFYHRSRKRGSGRPRTLRQVENPVVRVAAENRDWGYRRMLWAAYIRNADLQRSRRTLGRGRHAN